MKLSSIKPNPNNPRLIKDDRFKKLVNSIKEFPKMMDLRPIVVDNDNTILGGNMRYKALKELGYKEIPDTWIKRAEDLTVDEQRRFIAVDNIGFGEWNWVVLTNEWNTEEFSNWGGEIPQWDLGVPENEMNDDSINTNEEFDPFGKSAGQQRVVFIFDGEVEAESYLKSLKVEYKKMSQAWQVNLSTLSI